MSWEENVRRVEPYVPGEQPKRKDIIKLNTNECPYPPAPGVTAALERMDPASFRLYPDPDAKMLVHALAESYGLRDEQVFVSGSGSTSAGKSDCGFLSSSGGSGICGSRFG